MIRSLRGESKQNGVGKFEFLLLVAVIGLFASSLQDRLVAIERDAERTEVSLTIRNIQVGLRLAVGERLMRGQEDRLVELLDANPVSFLGRLPRGYAEELSGSADSTGTWHFDRATRILAYRPRLPEAFDGQTELRWKMASQGTIGGRIAGIRLESLTN